MINNTPTPVIPPAPREDAFITAMHADLKRQVDAVDTQKITKEERDAIQAKFSAELFILTLFSENIIQFTDKQKEKLLRSKTPLEDLYKVCSGLEPDNFPAAIKRYAETLNSEVYVFRVDNASQLPFRTRGSRSDVCEGVSAQRSAVSAI